MSSHPLPKLHNAMWPGLVGKGDGEGQEPAIGLDTMLEWTAAARVDGQRFDGIDYFLFHPHTDPDASEDDLRRIADKIAAHGFVRVDRRAEEPVARNEYRRYRCKRNDGCPLDPAVTRPRLLRVLIHGDAVPYVGRVRKQ